MHCKNALLKFLSQSEVVEQVYSSNAIENSTLSLEETDRWVRVGSHTAVNPTDILKLLQDMFIADRISFQDQVIETSSGI